MTVIAWDGKTLAADKQCTNAGYPTKVVKIFRVQGGIVGFAGNASHAHALLKWFEEGRDQNKWPKSQSDTAADAIFVDDTGKAFLYDGLNGPFAQPVYDKFAALGCGRDFALAAMFLGKGAFDAVQVACALDIHCGKGIDILEVE